eukprot:1362587-Amorphochlora_amoeboformis.AAC.1
MRKTEGCRERRGVSGKERERKGSRIWNMDERREGEKGREQKTERRERRLGLEGKVGAVPVCVLTVILYPAPDNVVEWGENKVRGRQVQLGICE